MRINIARPVLQLDRYRLQLRLQALAKGYVPRMEHRVTDPLKLHSMAPEISAHGERVLQGEVQGRRQRLHETEATLEGCESTPPYD
jgi:hypothetical protein